MVTNNEVKTILKICLKVAKPYQEIQPALCFCFGVWTCGSGGLRYVVGKEPRGSFAEIIFKSKANEEFKI